jgi:hypothetical protein
MMHQDTTPDLNMVGIKLKKILGVFIFRPHSQIILLLVESLQKKSLTGFMRFQIEKRPVTEQENWLWKFKRLFLMGISLCTWSLWGWFFSASWTNFRAARTAAS